MYADVAGGHGTPRTVGVTVETKCGEYWSGHAPVARSGEGSVEETVDVMYRRQILDGIEKPERHMLQSLLAARKERTIKDIVRLSVRLSYSTQQSSLQTAELVQKSG